jgi:DNA gyrase subunit B
MAKNYTAEHVGELEGLDKIVQNPGMYVGDNAEVGLNTLWRELVDNAVDEHLAGHGDKVEVTIAKNGALKVIDDGRGIPVEWKKDAEMSALELVLTRIHAGGKFKDSLSYITTRRGLHGAGAKAAVAFAKWFEVEVRRYGLAFRQRYENKGKPTTPVEIYEVKGNKRNLIGQVDETTVIKADKNGNLTELKIKGKPVSVSPNLELCTGTTVEFLPDRELFSPTLEWGDTPPWNVAAMKEFLWQMACLTPGLKFIFSANGDREVFQSKNGLVDFLGKMVANKPLLHPDPITFEQKVEVELPDGKAIIGLEVAMQYAGDDLPNIQAFANTLYNKDGGTHVKGFRDGLSEVLRELSESKRKKGDFKTDDLFVGLNAVVHATGTQRLQFNSQTKAALTSPEFAKNVREMASTALTKFFKKSSGQAIGVTIIDAAIASANARDTVKAARDLVVKRSLLDAGNGMALAKLSDVTRRGGQPVVPIEFTALYPCEGDSAAGTLKGARDSRFHAVYALRGKVENIYDKSLKDALDFAEFAALVTAIGAGVGPEFDPDAMRYGRVVVTTDADTDGAHIRALLIVFFYKFMQPMLSAGKLYIARPPLFRVRAKKDGSATYAYSMDERDTIIKQMGGGEKVDVQRFKGLGEMNAEQMAETVLKLPADAKMQKGKRGSDNHLGNLTIDDFTINESQVTLDDVKTAEKTLGLLMSKSQTDSRRKWLMGLKWHAEAE